MNARARSIALCAGVAAAAWGLQADAMALYSRQTGQVCAACHTAPPELTPFGRRFMLGGFTMGGGRTGIPLSGYVETGFTATSKDVPEPGRGLRANDNLDVQRLKAMTGGAITDSIGAFAEVSYSPIVERLKLGNVDIRYADSATIGRHDLVYGISVNNNPGFQDPWNSTPARTWPYARTAAGPIPRATPVLEGPLAQRAAGAGLYGFLDDALYVELAAYGGIGRSAQDALGVDPEGARTIEGPALYARLAWEKKLGTGSFTLGASAFDADLDHPGGVGTGTDRVRNLGVDALYQWARGPHEATVRASANRERWSLDSSVAQGLAAQSRNTLDSVRLSASWLYRKNYSGTLGFFRRAGSTDPLFFGTRNGRPDTTGYQFDAFVINPFFAPPVWHPGMRTRIGITYTHYTRFNGARADYDANGRSASANDTTFLYFLWAF